LYYYFTKQSLVTLISATAGTGTDLALAAAPTTYTVTSSTGTDVSLLAVTTTNMGIMLPADKTKVDRLTVADSTEGNLTDMRSDLDTVQSDITDLETESSLIRSSLGNSVGDPTMGAYTNTILSDSSAKVNIEEVADHAFATRTTVNFWTEAFETLTYVSPTTTWDFTTGPHKILTLTGNTTLSITGMTSGQCGILKLIQDATGSRTITLQANSIVGNGGSGAFTPTSTANAVDWLAVMYDGTKYNWNYIKNYT
jgi:hypothetical protein